MTPVLSILIPTLPQRSAFLSEILNEINRQIGNHPIQVLIDSRAEPTTGEKRNWLNENAIGEYVWQVDDDDMILPNAIDAIIKGLESKPDCLAINGIMTTDGKNLRKWDIRMGNPYEEINGIYYRYPNHITPIKTEIALQIKFHHITQQEDYKWATEMRDSGLLKTQVVVEIPVYHYRFRTKKTA